MLKIKNIFKTYKTGSLVQEALNDVSLNLRDNEFVAILGPSGSGKTTLLNIIGGLDRYDEGDLIINNVSTKNYKDRDWDTYRNHTIGFVFQSYNLIPHQSILSNVELALTIGGISKKERRKRALNALAEVGLDDQAHKRPNQMSGGQMQRVAIARALVNNPDILLADEPTGALDSKTSVQVMELLKKVANDRLVVMVTHNPELANEYANRIVNLKDGKIISDSNPFIVPDEPLDKKAKKVKKAHMSYLTALSLSFNNLLTKKGRTILTAFAGSIGIIGIALILSLSTGFQNYIDKIQEDTLSSYPLTINSETADTTSAILSMVADRREHQTEGDVVRERQYLTTMFSSIGSNDLKSLKKYLEEHEKEYADYVTNINYTYSIKPIIYTIDAADKVVKLNPSSLLGSIYSSSATSMISAFSSSGGSIFAEMNDDLDSYKDQYDVLAGRWPEKYDEMIIVLSEPNSISDLLVYSLGLRDTSELKTIITNVMAGEEAGVENEPQEFTYGDLLNIDMRLVLSPRIYKYNVQYNVYEDMSSDDEYMRDLFNRSLKLKIVGIMCAKDGNGSLALSTGVNYSKSLTQYVIDQCYSTSIVEKQLRNKDVDVFSGKRFDEENEDNKDQLDFQDMITVDEDMLKNAFKVNIKEDDFKFDMISQDEMASIVFESAKDAADMINNSPDRTTILGLLTAVNTQLLTTKISSQSGYEPSHVTAIDQSVYLLINNKDISALADTIDAQAYKNAVNEFINIMKQTNPEMAQISSMIDILNDDQYKRLADGVKAMFVDYYLQIRNNTDFIKDEGSEDGKIAYTVENNTVTYGSTLTNTSLLLTETTTNPVALANTAQVSNEIMENLLTYMIAAQIGVATGKIISPMTESLASLGSLFSNDFMTVDTDAFSKAFKFNLDQDELSRLMETMMRGSEEKTYKKNLISLGYQDVDDPTSISFYFKDFDSKEHFLDFLKAYNNSVDEDTKVRYTDITGILMSSVKTIVDVVTYVLIAFVSISLVVSSIMIAVITLISVLERKKEIGILRAMGASKRNVSSIFSAETFIIGLLSGLLGVGVTLASLPLINTIIHNVTDNYDVNAVLPTEGAIALIIISVLLTIIAGFIPSKKAAKQDPVIALRTE